MKWRKTLWVGCISKSWRGPSLSGLLVMHAKQCGSDDQRCWEHYRFLRCLLFLLSDMLQRSCQVAVFFRLSKLKIFKDELNYTKTDFFHLLRAMFSHVKLQVLASDLAHLLSQFNLSSVFQSIIVLERSIWCFYDSGLPVPQWSSYL